MSAKPLAGASAGSLKPGYQGNPLVCCSCPAIATTFSSSLACALVFFAFLLSSIDAYANRAPWLEPLSQHQLASGEALDLIIRPYDPDGTVPSLHMLNAPAQARLLDAGDGGRRLIWIPPPGASGNFVIILQARDSQDPTLQASRRLEITVQGEAGAAESSQQAVSPVAQVIAAEQAALNNPDSEQLGFDSAFPLSDVRLAPLESISRVVKAFSDAGVPGLYLKEGPAGARLTDNRDGTRTFSWTPSSGVTGDFRVVVATQHPGNAALVREAAFTIQVGQQIVEASPLVVSVDSSMANQPAVFNDHRPVIQPLADQFMEPGGAVIFKVTPVDPDGTYATLIAEPLPARATFDDNGDGTRTFFWQTRDSDRGQHTITFTAIDGLDSNLSHSESVRITIGQAQGAVVEAEASSTELSGTQGGGNGQINTMTAAQVELTLPAPASTRSDLLYFDPIESISVQANRNVSQTIRARVAGDRPVPALKVLNAPSGASFTDNRDGSRQFVWTPGDGDMGEHTLEFQAIDGRDASVTAQVSLQISVVASVMTADEILQNGVSTNTNLISIRPQTEHLGRPNQNLEFTLQPVHDGRPVPSLLLRNAPRGSALYDNGDGTRLFAWTPNNDQIGIFTPEVIAVDAWDSSLFYVLPLRLVVTSDVAGTTSIVDAGSAPRQPQTRSDAALFLHRATFGPRVEDIDALMGKTYEQWINDQFVAPISSHRDRLDGYLWDRGLFNISTGDRQLERSQLRSDAFWDVVISAGDQLRQRVAFALSQILVISDRDPALENRVRGFAQYHDILLRHAFGNYRELLTEIALNPMMGDYLSSRRNEKADPALNIEPDENFARELMQLFTIGLDQLEIDGSRKRDQDGNRLLAYTQDDVMSFARVFTGWNYGDAREMRDDRRTLESEILPMKSFEGYHDQDPKQLLNGVVISGGRSARDDLNLALDNLFQHPNVPPFIARQLIQRLVTSNPTPAYVARIANTFINDGGGSRGNLAAVVKAILLDPEALNGHRLDPYQFGKLKEPVLKVTSLWRAFYARGRFNRLRYVDSDQDFAQQPYGSPSVFNFYSPDYQPPGRIGDLGLYAPEAQIINESTALRGNNRLFDYAFEVPLGNDEIFANQHQVVLDIGRQRALAGNPGALVAQLDELLLAGKMSQLMTEVVQQLVEGTPLDDNGSARVREAIYLIVASPEFSLQR